MFAVVAGGGTAGHVVPAIAILEQLREAGWSADDLGYVGSLRGPESRLVAPLGVHARFLDVDGVQRSLAPRTVLRTLRAAVGLLRAGRQMRTWFAAHAPRVVVSVGGYASVPATMAARWLRIPVVTVSYDAVPGLATRRQARHSVVSIVAHAQSPLRNAVHVGAPVRASLRHLDVAARRVEARRRLGVSPHRTVVTVIGGSLGSRVLNDATVACVASLRNRRDLAVVHLCGGRYVDDPLPSDTGDVEYRRIASVDDMTDVWAATDIAVTRAGASTIAEIATVGVAAIVVPWSGAAGDHQALNAHTLADHGAAIALAESDAVAQLPRLVASLLDDPVRRGDIAGRARSAGAGHRRAAIAETIMSAVDAPAPLVDLGAARRIHVVGAGGPGMSALAHVLAEMGHGTSGSDVRESATVARLRDAGIPVNVPHDPNVVVGCDAVTYSSAIPATNVELAAARSAGVRVVSRATMLGSVCARTRAVSVAGTHGKTTTSALLATMLRDAGMDPGWYVGGDVRGLGGNAHWGSGPFVVEADESDSTHTALQPRATILTNVDVDHLDEHGSLDGIIASFDRHLAAVPGTRVVCGDDPGAASLARRHGATTYGIVADAQGSVGSPDMVARDVRFEHGGATFTALYRGKPLGEVRLALRGRHNVLNALGALTMAIELGADAPSCLRTLATFGGVARRFDTRHVVDGITLVDDYAHLPAEITAVLAAARGSTDTWRRIVAVFQPNRFNRMAVLSPEYRDAFVGADLVVITDIYSSGTAPIAGVTGELVVDAVRAAHPQAAVEWRATRDELVEFLAGELRAGDVCISMGCGDIETLPDEVVARRRDLTRGA
ncbi:MAG: UDP-N-acetylmuramate--L-alanine ligase [Ilumatobacteraceae bacterium]